MNRISDDSKPETDSVLYVVGGTEEDRRSLGALLSRLGREVRNKSSAEELLETLTPARPFVLVSTISLPGMDGMELLRELRNRGIPAPTILISDQSDIPTAVDAIRAGAENLIIAGIGGVVAYYIGSLVEGVVIA